MPQNGDMLDKDLCWRMVRHRDPRFDGVFFVAVTTTGVYCRPSCPARTPNREHVRFYPTAAAAQRAGFRACKRCRPDASPGSPDWDTRADVAGRAMRLIQDGVVDRDGVGSLARRLGYGPRQLQRLLVSELGAGPLALARAHRAQAARTLLQTTSLPIADVAFAAGFSSLRQFNATIQDVFAETPTGLRMRARRPGDGVAPADVIRLRLPLRPPYDFPRLLAFLRVRAVPGVEVVEQGVYRRVLTLPRGLGVVAVRQARTEDPFLICDLELGDLRDLPTAVERVRRLCDLDADPAAVSEVLAGDGILGPLAAEMPGLRVPGAVDGAEIALRAVLGQQVSVAGARTLAGRLAEAWGEPLARARGPLLRAFPTPERLAAADPATLRLPRARARTLLAVAELLAARRLELDPGADRDEAARILLAVRGIGPWTVGYVRMRALGDPDVFLPTDLGVRKALAAAGQSSGAAALAERWRPWRSYAVQHLWQGGHAPATPRREGR